MIVIDTKTGCKSLSKIQWKFTETIFESEEEFRTAVITYIKDIKRMESQEIEEILKSEVKSNDRKDEISISLSHVFVVYTDTDEYDEYGNAKCVKITMQATTVASLLFQLHNQLVHYNLGNHVYYEGFNYCEGYLILKLGS